MTVPKLRVLFVHQAAELYGSDKVLLYLVQGLLQTGAVEAIVVLPNDGPLREALAQVGAQVHIAPIGKVRRAVFSPSGVWNLLREMAAGARALDGIVGGRRIDIVHSNTLAVLVGAWWSWRRRVVHVWHVHEIILKPALVGWALCRLVALASRAAITNSKMTDEWVRSQAPSLQRSTAMIFNGLPAQAAASPSLVAAFRGRLNAGPDAVVITLAGRINHWKGQGLLVQAVGLLRRRMPMVALRVAIVGDTAPGQEALQTELEAKIKQAELGDWVHILPFTPDIGAVWAGSDIAVVPSTEPEPFGMVAIEAMAASLPVVAAAHGGLLDIVVDGDTGLLFPPGDAERLADALQRLLESQPLRRQFGVAGAQRQKDCFSVAAQVDQTLALYRSPGNTGSKP